MSDSRPIRRILVVDDDSLILHVLEMALYGYGEIKTVGTAEAALEEVGARFHDLCFLDIILPGLNGLEAMEKIRAISPGTKVVIMTASHLNNQMRQAIEECAYHLIEKPFKLAQIREIAKQALQSTQGGRYDNKKIALEKAHKAEWLFHVREQGPAQGGGGSNMVFGHVLRWSP